MSDAMKLAIVMGFEAMRICLGLKTRHYAPAEVIRWMQLMTK
jgi:hypothetical protein